MTDFDLMIPNTLGSPLICDVMHKEFSSIPEEQQSDCKIQLVDEISLINCPPQGVAPSDLNKVIGNFTAEQGVKKYYVSELIGIKPGDQPSYGVFPSDINDMPVDKQNEAINFISKFYQLMDGNDLCDKEGIMFIGRYLRHYCPHSENYKNLDSEQVQFVDSLIQSTAPVMELAKKWANCK